MLTATSISCIRHPYFNEWWHLYESAFPVTERRSVHMHAKALEHSAFHCLYLEDSAGFGGIMAYWQWQNMVFLEHLAIVAERRGQGLGHQALDMLQGRVLLEIEPVADAQTARRLAFYESYGFCRLPHPHVQLAYQSGQPDIPLWLLSRPRVSDAEVQVFEREYLLGPMQYRDTAGK